MRATATMDELTWEERYWKATCALLAMEMRALDAEAELGVHRTKDLQICPAVLSTAQDEMKHRIQLGAAAAATAAKNRRLA